MRHDMPWKRTSKEAASTSAKYRYGKRSENNKFVKPFNRMQTNFERCLGFSMGIYATALQRTEGRKLPEMQMRDPACINIANM